MSDAYGHPEPELSDAARELENEIFDEAMHSPPPKEEAAANDNKEPAQEANDNGGQARDEQGRFKSAEPEQKAAPEQQQQQQDAQAGDQQKQAEGKDDGENVPRWRVREIAEERRQALAERDALRAELARAQVARQQHERQQPAQQQQQIDPLLDPQGFVNAMRAEFDQRLRTEQLNNNLALTHMRHGKDFEQAYEALLDQGQRGNGQLIRHLTAQANPGEAIVAWWKQGELMRATGGDVGKFKEGLRAELLKDPEFRKAVIEAMRSEANGGQPNGQGNVRNITQLPPSLARAGSSANANDPIDTDDSDAAVFAHAWNR